MTMAIVAAFFIGYLVGAIPFGLLLTRAAGLGDIRRIGSGNIGATNVLRTGNRKLAAATLLLDGGKGAVGAIVGWWCAGEPGLLLGGLGSVVGHLFPIWLAFRGGRGVATGFGVLFALGWPVGLASGAVWLLVVSLTRISSLGALSAFAVAPILAILLTSTPVAVTVLIIAFLVITRHSDNIGRLWAGTEPKMGRKQ